MSLADVDKATLSPMMQQYAEMKESLGDTFLFYRLGDFYEMFFDDAVKGSKILELALTKRDCPYASSLKIRPSRKASLSAASPGS